MEFYRSLKEQEQSYKNLGKFLQNDTLPFLFLFIWTERYSEVTLQIYHTDKTLH